MTLTDFCWFTAGLCLGATIGLFRLTSEQKAHTRQVRALIAAYEARVAEILGKLR